MPKIKTLTQNSQRLDFSFSQWSSPNLNIVKNRFDSIYKTIMEFFLNKTNRIFNTIFSFWKGKAWVIRNKILNKKYFLFVTCSHTVGILWFLENIVKDFWTQFFNFPKSWKRFCYVKKQSFHKENISWKSSTIFSLIKILFGLKEVT